jgi:hypothetical protein
MFRTKRPMVAPMGSVIRLVSLVACGLVLLGFAYFAADEIDRGSKGQQNQLAGELQGSDAEVIPIAPPPQLEATRELQHGGFREVVDDAGDILLAPFSELVDSNHPWLRRGVPTILALLLYGLGLGTLARMLPRQRAHAGDWRTADT